MKKTLAFLTGLAALGVALCSCNKEEYEWQKFEAVSMEISGATFESTGSPLYLQGTVAPEGTTFTVAITEPANIPAFPQSGDVSYTDTSLADLQASFATDAGQDFDSEWCAIHYLKPTPPYEVEITIPANNIGDRTIEIQFSAPNRLTSLKIHQSALQ